MAKRFEHRVLKTAKYDPHHTVLVFAAAAVLILTPLFAAAQEEEDDIEPVRPSVSESASVQKKGVLQAEYGIDFDFRSPEFKNQQAGQLGIYYAPSKRLRLDFELGTFVSRKDETGTRETGIGDVNLGFKAIARDKPEEHLAVGFGYSVKLPTANEDKELGTGRVDHDVRLILNRKYGKNDLVMNVSYLNVGRDDSDRRASGAQMALGYQRELPRNFGLETEIVGTSVDTRQLARGIYTLAALTYKVNKRVRLDWGVRPGFGPDAPKMNFFFGISTGVTKPQED
jgi:hypothetical protein